MRRRRGAAGLTVIEMMVVVAVVAVILGLAAPSLYGFLARQRVKSVNAELVNDIQYARSEAIARRTPVRITFRSDAPDLTCYTIHTIGTAGLCDCRTAPGSACIGYVELKTVQVPRSTTVTVVAPQGDVLFSETQGISNREDFRIGVESTISGRLRTATNLAGRPQVCSPDGSISGVATCAD